LIEVGLVCKLYRVCCCCFISEAYLCDIFGQRNNRAQKLTSCVS